MDELNIKEIMQRIELCIAEQGMTKTEFYKKSGISSANFAQWNTGKHAPTKKKLAMAATALTVSLEYILFGTEPRTHFINQKETIKPTIPEGDVISDIKRELIERIINGSDDQAEFICDLLDRMK